MIVKAVCSLVILSSVYAAMAADPSTVKPVNFLYTNSGDLTSIQKLLKRPDIEGVQVVYNWRDLEAAKDTYTFEAIENDLRALNDIHKKLFIQVQDRFFLPKDKNIPNYLMEDPIYTGGLVSQTDNPGEGKPVNMGWVAEQWNPHVQARYQKLLEALGEEFDGRLYGVNLPESAIDVDAKHDKTGFSCDKYFRAELENMSAAKKAFPKSIVVQYVNFWPCGWGNDHGYMEKTFVHAIEIGVGLGGPDIVPYGKGQMQNSYPFFHLYRNKLPLVAMAVQEATLTYTNPKTKKHFTKEEFSDFAMNYLGAKIIFWSTSTPWLKE